MDIKEVYMEKKNNSEKTKLHSHLLLMTPTIFFREIVFTEKSKKKEKERKSRTKKTTTNT